MVALYTADYARTRDAMLADLAVAPLVNLQQAVQDLYIPASSHLQDLLRPETPGAAPPGQAIDDHYRALRDLVGHGRGAALDVALKLLNDLQRQLAVLAGAGAGGTAAAVAGGPGPEQRLRAEASHQPPPVAGWLLTLAATADRLRGGGPAALCRHTVGGVEPPLAEDGLAQFQRVAAIRDLFFGAGGTTPVVRFDITPVSADPATRQVTLDFNGITVVDTHRPARATQITWPGHNGLPRRSPPARATTSAPW